MKQPILEYPGRAKAVLEPLAPRAKDKRLPRRCVLCFFTEVIRKLSRRGELELVKQLHGEGDPIQIHVLGTGRRAVSVCRPGLTAPYATVVLEQLIALGCNSFIACGGAGVLDGSIEPGRLLLPTAALRDEGTSYHYMQAGRYSRPHPQAVTAIRKTFAQNNIEFIEGKTWTTDAVYRETPRQVKRRRAEGCLCVDMEAAAFFAVARFRKVRLGQIFYAGDDVSGPEWDSRNWRKLKKTREELFWLAVEACRRLPTRL
ncbi:MAG: nucleoside phosphorylase [Deltaproteobacteria bacterium]|nr:nucleoside phosphorylase [Deltaproteobacteria bacterium]